jgi:hypothetical protein
MLVIVSWLMALVSVTAQAPARSPAAPSATLDFEYFHTRVQPIFLAKRPGHARCISCHAGHTPMPLQPLPAGGAWNEDASRRNFDAVSRMVVPGSLTSPLLLHPLAPEAGGDLFHSGGKHWSSRDEPEWQTLAAWVRGEKAGSPKHP